MNKRLGICLNWKIVAGLVAVGLGVLVLVPNLLGTVLPILLVAACPLSMLVMMWSMRGGHGAAQPAMSSPAAADEQPYQERLAVLKAQHEAMGREIAQLEAAQAAALYPAEARVKEQV